MRRDRPVADPAALTTLRQMIQRAPGRVSRRAQAVVWWLGGESRATIARRLGVSRQSVNGWCARFRGAGPDGAWARPRSGRPPRLGAGAPARVAVCSRRSDRPGTTGPGGGTVARLVAALAEQGAPIGARTGRRLPRRLRARWRRGRPVAKGDPDRLAVPRRLANGLLAAHPAARRAGRPLVVLVEDEADLALLPHAGYSGQLPDQAAAVPAPGQNQEVGLFGSLSPDGEVVVTEAPRKTAAALTAHLAAVAARFPDAEVAASMDNVGIPHAKATKAWLEAHPRVHPLFLPRDRPNDNAQERVWGWLRADVCRNRAFPGLATKRAAAQEFLAALSPAALCRRCVPVPLLTGLLAEAFAADAAAPSTPTAPVAPFAAAPDDRVPPANELLAA